MSNVYPGVNVPIIAQFLKLIWKNGMFSLNEMCEMRDPVTISTKYGPWL